MYPSVRVAAGRPAGFLADQTTLAGWLAGWLASLALERPTFAFNFTSNLLLPRDVRHKAAGLACAGPSSCCFALIWLPSLVYLFLSRPLKSERVFYASAVERSPWRLWAELSEQLARVVVLMARSLSLLLSNSANNDRAKERIQFRSVSSFGAKRASTRLRERSATGHYLAAQR